MLRWFVNLFRRPLAERWERDSRKAHEYAHKMISRHEGIEPVEFSLPIKIQADGITPDGVPWAWIHGIRAGGWIEISPPHNIYIAVSSANWKRWVLEHEKGHEHLGATIGIWNHDRRFDRYFRGWAETRRSLGYALVDFARHPIAGQTGLRGLEREGLMIDEIIKPKGKNYEE